MRRYAFLALLPAAVCAEPRIARVAYVEGKVEVRPASSGALSEAVLHLPVLEGTRLLADASSRIEVELDELSVFRLAPDSGAELADYTRLSTGQRITHLALDRGGAYFSGDLARRDVVVLSVPGVQASLVRGSRVRLEADSTFSRISVIEGEVRVYSPHFEVNLHEGTALRIGANSGRFSVEREIAEADSDGWSRGRDKLLPLRQGRADLDAAGAWIDTAEFGAVWKPKTAEGWVPFRDGRWRWFDGVGYVWIPRESWGWLAYHSGRWLNQPSLGWIWVPGQSGFHPGAVYWMAGRNFLGWGPLAPGEMWTAQAVPERYLAAYTTFAPAVAEADEIDPAGFTPPIRDPLTAARFVAHPPARNAAWAVRESDRQGVIRLNPELPPPPAPTPPPAIETRAPKPVPQPFPQPQLQPVLVQPAASPVAVSPIEETYYLAPIYTGIIIMNPPERDPDKDHEKKGDHPRRRVERPGDGAVARGEDPTRRSR